MKLFSIFAAGALGLACTACATGPEYHALKGGVGYSDAQLQDNRFSVSFAGDGSTPRDKVEQFLLYRAAQLTLANGYDYFIIMNNQTDKSTSYHSYGFGNRWVGPGWYRPGWRAWWGVDPVLDDNVDTVPSNRFNATATITMKKGVAPAGNSSAYNAQQLVNSLGPKISVAAKS